MIQDHSVVSPPPFTRWAWRGILALFMVALLGILANQVGPKGGDTEAPTPDESCLPGEAVPILAYPHISERAAADVVYNSNPPTSGPHFSAAVAPGIYQSYLPPGLTVHSLEHGRVVIHYRTGTPDDVVGMLESIAKRYAPNIVLTPNPEIETSIALTAWGRIDKLDHYDEARISAFVEQLSARYNHEYTARANGCAGQ